MLNLQVAVIEIRQAGIFPEKTRLHFAAEDKHRRGRAVVGSAVGVFLHPPAKFAEGQEQDALEISLLLQVGDEGGERVVQFRHETIVRVELPGMGVEAALAGVVNPRR